MLSHHNAAHFSCSKCECQENPLLSPASSKSHGKAPRPGEGLPLSPRLYVSPTTVMIWKIDLKFSMAISLPIKGKEHDYEDTSYC